jgi:hypothetical protein
MKRLVLPQLIFLLAFSFTSWAQSRTISAATARKLVREALPAFGENESSVRIAPWKYKWAPEFYTFQAWGRPNRVATEGVGVLQTYYFAVNPWTGDVWDAIACSRITSPTLKKEQELILLKRSYLSLEKREALSNKSPGCSR